MADALGFRLKLGIIAPSTNMSVQPEMEQAVTSVVSFDAPWTTK
jgi:hypothetical protein